MLFAFFQAPLDYEFILDTLNFDSLGINLYHPILVSWL